MRFRKLRIAWSVAWGVIAVLLIVLWVRSYWWYDLIMEGISDTRGITGSSWEGELSLSWAPIEQSIGEFHWATEAEGVSSPTKVLGFSIDVRSFGDWEVTVQHWLVILVIGIVAVVPWIRQLNWRFSLRTLLIATTLLAVVLGFAVWAAS
jgi:hypothetical protein